MKRDPDFRHQRHAGDTADAEFTDRQITCADCQDDFIWTARDQRYYREKNFTPPKRCRPCREVAREQREKRRAANR